MKWQIALLIFALLVLNLSAQGLTPVEREMTNAVSQEQLKRSIEELIAFSPRLVGSGTLDDEALGANLATAEFIESRLKSYGLKTRIEAFSVMAYQVYEYSLLVDFDGDPQTTDRLDLTENSAPFIPRYYWDGVPTVIDMQLQKKLIILNEDAEERDFSDSVVLASDYSFWKDKETLLKKTRNAAARLAYHEGVPYTVIYNQYNTFSISEEDYETIIEKATPDTKVFLTYKTQMKTTDGYNIVGKIEGGDDKEVIFTAHIDTVYSKGAIDNGSGIASLLEVARILSEYKFKHDIVFVFVDAEEVGGNGSKDYVNAHESELKDAVGAINVDCIASGTPDGMTVGFNHKYPDLMKRWGIFWQYQKTDSRLDQLIRGVANEMVGYSPESMYVEYIAGGSDFGNFTEKNIPATDMGWIDRGATKLPAVSDKRETETSEVRWEVGSTKYYSTFGRFSEVIPYIHTLEDKPENVNMEYLLSATRVLLVSSERMAKLDEGKEAGIGACLIAAFLYALLLPGRKP